MDNHEKEWIVKLYGEEIGHVHQVSDTVYQLGNFKVQKEERLLHALTKAFGEQYEFMVFTGENRRQNLWIDVLFPFEQEDYVISSHYNREEKVITIEAGVLAELNVMWDEPMNEQSNFREIMHFIQHYLCEESWLRLEILTNGVFFVQKEKRGY